MAGQPGSSKEGGNDERDRMDRRDLESCDRMQLPDAVFGLLQLLKGGERRISRNADLPGDPRRGQSPRVFTCSDVAAHLSPLAFARHHQTVDGGF